MEKEKKDICPECAETMGVILLEVDGCSAPIDEVEVTADSPSKVNKSGIAKKEVAAKKKRDLKATADFKKKYFDYYDDIKISAREDW